MLKRVLPLVAVIAVFAPVRAQEKLNADINSRIRQEAASHSQLAMRDEMVPRFAPGDMPPPVVRTSSAQ